MLRIYCFIFGVILLLNPRGKISTFSINPVTSDENQNYKVHTIKTLLDSAASASITRSLR